MECRDWLGFELRVDQDIVHIWACMECLLVVRSMCGGENRNRLEWMECVES